MKSTEKRSWKTIEYRLNQVFTCQFIDCNKQAKEITPTDIKLMLLEFIERGALVGSNKIRAVVHMAFNYGLKVDNELANIRNTMIHGLEFNSITVVPKQQSIEIVGNRFSSWLQLKELIDNYNKPFEE